MGRVFGGLAVVGAALLAATSLAACGGKGDDKGASDASGTTAVTGKPQTIQGKAHVTGAVTAVYGVQSSLEPIPAPFTITVPDAGRGGLDLPSALVGGKPNAIIWSGGRPLPVTGTCGLDVGEANVTVDSAGAHIALDNQARAFTKGTCTFGSSVAIGSHGLSSPAASVTFTLPQAADFTTTGGATVTVPAARRYEGHEGSKLGLIGPMHVETETDEFDAAGVALSSGTWVVTISATKTGAMQIDAALEGALVVNRA